MNLSKAIFFSAALLSLNTMAADSLVANVFVLNNHKQSTSSNNLLHSYLTKESRSQVYTVMRGTGKLASINQTKNENKVTVIGVDVNGYSQITLKDLGNGRISVKTDSNLSASDGGVTMDLSHQLETEAVITKGSWAQYTAGEEIEFQLTPNSLEKETAVTGQSLARTIESGIKNALARSGMGSVKIKTELKVKTPSDDAQVCKATLANLDCYRAKQEFEILFSVKGL